MDLSVVFVPLLSGVEGLATQTALEFLLCQDTSSRVSSPIPKSSEFPFYLEIRMKHFTEIENFTFLAHVLGHELGGTTPRPIRTVTDLQVPDEEFQSFVNQAKTVNVTDEELADSVLDVGINWEHFVASTDNELLPDHPLKISDVLMQEKIDSLDVITEALVREINLRSIEKQTGTKPRKSHE